MKSLILKTYALSFLIALTSFSASTQAQKNTETLIPIIDLILNDSGPITSPEKNSPPVNTVPATTAQFPIQFNSGEITALPVSVDDVDGNLASILVNFSSDGLISIDPNADVDIQVQASPPGFIFTGSQENLAQAITSLFYSPLLGSIEGDVLVEITITSTDSLGEFDQDSFFVNFENPPLIDQ